MLGSCLCYFSPKVQYTIYPLGGYNSDSLAKPQTKDGANSFGGLGATLIDSLDTLYIMGLDEQFQRAREESFMRICKTGNRIDFDRKGFEIWKNLSKEKRHIYVLQAQKVNSVYMGALFKEADAMTQVDDEADSVMVGKFDLDCRFPMSITQISFTMQSYDDYESSE